MTRHLPPAPAVNIAPGCQYRVRYPFYREARTLSECDEEGWSTRDVLAWVPGVYGYTDQEGYSERLFGLCDGEGEQVLDVVSLHKPGRYPERVFYLRQWVTPDGVVFGKKSLRVCTREKFMRTCVGYGTAMVRGYRVQPREVVTEAKV